LIDDARLAMKERSMGKEIQEMNHQCGENCPCREDLDKAVASLVVASKLLSASIIIDSEDVTEHRFALLRVAKAKVWAAAAYQDQLAEAA
jgi:hypothetical protein